MTTFVDKYGARYENAVICLTRDGVTQFSFDDVPAEHWDHLRTSTPTESVFATVRHRIVRTKGVLSQKTAKLLEFKLVQAAANTWRGRKGANQLSWVIEVAAFNADVAANGTANRGA